MSHTTGGKLKKIRIHYRIRLVKPLDNRESNKQVWYGVVMYGHVIKCFVPDQHMLRKIQTVTSTRASVIVKLPADEFPTVPKPW
ncbi:hypothetical protein EVAR_17193_1 [Eumeta japonica]|uniref:Uncharacterized protein n=1 Tax=Eumeta variegata TaxID=151549 RepID=A0A4C1U943_EUMVA|nr:hypothetical protein EVAR_17193_1 [Eumeta japonica]